MTLPAKPMMPAYRHHLLVCVGERCVADGMTPQALEGVGRKLISAGLLVEGERRVKPSRVNCLGACRSGPVMCVQPDGVWYYGVTSADMDRIIEQHLIGGRAVEDRVFHRWPGLDAANSCDGDQCFAADAQRP